MTVPGFTVKQLPVDLPNINNIKCKEELPMLKSPSECFHRPEEVSRIAPAELKRTINNNSSNNFETRKFNRCKAS